MRTRKEIREAARAWTEAISWAASRIPKMVSKANKDNQTSREEA